jgi:DUF1680 family protein
VINIMNQTLRVKLQKVMMPSFHRDATPATKSGFLRYLWYVLIMRALFSAFLSDVSAADPPQMKGQRRIETFDYRGVTLDGGHARLMLDETKEYYLRIPNDDLLKGFRQRAGHNAPGRDLGGWYTPDTFHVFGQIVSGLSRIYAATRDPTCREKVDALISEWDSCIADDGYFYASAKPNAPHYIYDKIVGGLVDASIYCENRKALKSLRRITVWAETNLEQSRRVGDTSTEWYTLSENLYRAYRVTGEQTYRDFAKKWEYPEYWDIYARQADPFAVRPGGGRNDAYHAYSHVNTLGGAGMAFLVTGEPQYLQVLRNAYDYFQDHQCFATGGYGPDEQILPQEPLVARLGTSANTFETQCGTWAGFKLVKHLITLTGDAKYGDWAERLLINGLGATIPMGADGRVMYYSNYNSSGGQKRNTDFGWSCCTGTRPQAVADVCDLVYFHDADSLYCNLFTPSHVIWQQGSTTVVVKQRTRFPDDDIVEFSVETDSPAEFSLKIRSPGWLASEPVVKVNGDPQTSKVDEFHWITLRRNWLTGDSVSMKLPMSLQSKPLIAGKSYPTAITYGPVVLAARAADSRFIQHVDFANLSQSLTRVDGESLTWRLRSDPEVLLRPFYAYQEGETYYLYLDPSSIWRIPFRSVTFGGHWNEAAPFRFTNSVGATAEYTFEGTGIRWLGYRFDDAGRARVTIDGQQVDVVSQYGPGRDLPFDWSHQDLKPGKHTIKLTLIEDKDAASRDRFINVAGFEIIPVK